MEKALEDVKTLDLSRVQAGPSCAQVLGFLGTDVIRLEDTDGGDRTCSELAHVEDQDSVYFTLSKGVFPQARTGDHENVGWRGSRVGW